MADGGGTSGDVLLRALEDLTKADLKRFKDKLSEINFKGQQNIPRGSLEDADRIDTKNLLVRFYGPDSAIDVTIEVFSKVCLMEAAARLREERPRVLDPQEAREDPETTSETFIKEHRLNLSKRMGNIKLIMEILQDKGILQDDEVEEVLAEKTSSSKNSTLIRMVVKKGTKSQEEFLRALQETDPYLYNDLQES
ncbi:apoptosis-associated speck-like protein containing a CARD isoform X2 [Lissotriton helveticus]